MNAPTTDALVERATEVRDHLLSVFEALDRKRHALTSPAALAKQAFARPSVRPLVIGAGALAALATVVLAVNGYRRSAARQRRSAVARQVGLSLATVVVSQFGRVAVNELTARWSRSR